ncbi:hypothetical protein DFH07DRAFT_870069 [Mycena maculata]|uniref:Integrase core domain-containing protein n=1 Tax=Mycena maculata TaxID=230809 RepID=A0AAD7N1V3_9AGAR|nr:hypothetical protein DFH07DRAFT_870069 [Mycena maculata]
MDAIQAYGTPSRMRGDRGGENTKVSIWMIIHRGPGRASFMWGLSTRNTRIERLWVEVGTQFARRWRAFFTRLGRLHHLDRKNPTHLWLLHRLFLKAINNDCREFQDEWNLHPISGRTTSDQSPADIRFLGQTTQGIYAVDPLDGIHPDAIKRYYGVEGAGRRPRNGQTGAGHASDDEEENEDSDNDIEPDLEEELENQIQEDQAQNIRHAPVKVARHHSPFEEREDEAAFLELLDIVITQPDVLPEGYGILPDEWEDEDYDEIETIRTGTNGKELVVVLPRVEWFLRAAKWVQALDLLTRVLSEMDNG